MSKHQSPTTEEFQASLDAITLTPNIRGFNLTKTQADALVLRISAEIYERAGRDVE